VREREDTYVLLPLMHGFDEEDDIGNMAMICGVKCIKIQVLAILQEGRKGVVDAQGRGCFWMGLDDWTRIVSSRTPEGGVGLARVLMLLDEKLCEKAS